MFTENNKIILIHNIIIQFYIILIPSSIKEPRSGIRVDGLLVDSYKESWFLFNIIPWCRTHGESTPLFLQNEESRLGRVRRLDIFHQDATKSAFLTLLIS